MLISTPPTDWKGLQSEVARILSECVSLTKTDKAEFKARQGRSANTVWRY